MEISFSVRLFYSHSLFAYFTYFLFFFFFSSRRRHTRFDCDWSSDVCSSDLSVLQGVGRLAFSPELRITAASARSRLGTERSAARPDAARQDMIVRRPVFPPSQHSSLSRKDSKGFAPGNERQTRERHRCRSTNTSSSRAKTRARSRSKS